MKEGGFAHFEARLEPMGDHTMKVEWFKDGKPVEASSRYKIIEWHFVMRGTYRLFYKTLVFFRRHWTTIGR